MRKVFLLAVICGVWGGSQAMASSLCSVVAGNLVSNCGFETGDFTGWTIGGDTDNPGGYYFGVDGFDANSGNDGAFMSQDFNDDGIGSVSLSQTLATTAGDTYSVSFWLDQDTPPYVNYIHSFDSTFGSSTLLNITPRVALPGAVGTYTQYTYSETATGASTALTFSFENDDWFWSFDDVSVTDTSASATPEPSTWILAGAALGALFLLKRVRSSSH